jgi:hypothetical protein
MQMAEETNLYDIFPSESVHAMNEDTTKPLCSPYNQYVPNFRSIRIMIL